MKGGLKTNKVLECKKNLHLNNAGFKQIYKPLRTKSSRHSSIAIAREC